jgi:hypothetical protein
MDISSLSTSTSTSTSTSLSELIFTTPNFNKDFIEGLIRSTQKGEKHLMLIDHIKEFLNSGDFESQLTKLFEINDQLECSFKQIFLDAFYLYILDILNSSIDPNLLEKVLFLFYEKNLLKKFSQKNTDNFFTALSIIYLNLRGTSKDPEKLHSCLWHLLITSRNKISSQNFKELLVARFTTITNHPNWFPKDFNLSEERVIIAESINLADSNAIRTLQELIELAKITQKNATETAQKTDDVKNKILILEEEKKSINLTLISFQDRITELKKEINDLETTLKKKIAYYKQDLKSTEKQLRKEKASTESELNNLLLKSSDWETNLEKIQKEKELKQASLEAFLNQKIASLQADFSEKIVPLKNAVSIQKKQIEKLISTLIARNEVPLPHSIQNDSFLVLNEMLNLSSSKALYKMDKTIVFETIFSEITAYVKKLESISFTGTAEVASIRAEKIRILSTRGHFDSILQALNVEFIPTTAGFMLESLTTHTITIVESCCKLLLTDLDPEALSSTLTGQKVSIERSHRIVDMLRLICEKLNVAKKYKSTIDTLSNIKANSIRPEYLPSSTTTTISLEEVLLGLRLSLQEDSLSDNGEATSIQIKNIIIWMEQLLSFSADLMKLHIERSFIKAK